MIPSLQETFSVALNKKTLGSSSAQTFDFPDYPNVGDSAIYLGQLQGLAKANIKIDKVHRLSSPLPLDKDWPALSIYQGGGNLCSEYEHFDHHRLLLLSSLRPDSVVVVMPQSIGGKFEAMLPLYKKHSEHLEITFFARDKFTLERLNEAGFQVELVPDAAHMLGHLDVPEPVQKYTLLERRDSESSHQSRSPNSVDWPREPFIERTSQKIRDLGYFSERLGRRLDKGESQALALSEWRLRRGIAAISKGETVVTDRLHGMILALQMGRKVVAIDNSNQKLSRYAKTWDLESSGDLVFATSFEQFDHF